MHAMLVTLVAAEEIDPATVRPVPLSAVVFTLLLVAMLLLLRSFLRHLRRAQSNLGPAKQVPGGARLGESSPGRADQVTDDGSADDPAAGGRAHTRSAGSGQVPGDPA